MHKFIFHHLINKLKHSISHLMVRFIDSMLKINRCIRKQVYILDQVRALEEELLQKISFIVHKVFSNTSIYFSALNQ